MWNGWPRCVTERPARAFGGRAKIGRQKVVVVFMRLFHFGGHINWLAFRLIHL